MRLQLADCDVVAPQNLCVAGRTPSCCVCSKKMCEAHFEVFGVTNTVFNCMVVMRLPIEGTAVSAVDMNISIGTCNHLGVCIRQHLGAASTMHTIEIRCLHICRKQNKFVRRQIVANL